MADADENIYSFAGFRLHPAERSFHDQAKGNIPLAPKVFDTLLMLVRNSGHVVSKERMLAEIWDDSFVEENNLAQNISHLRRLLGESNELKFIETVPKFGYRFVAGVDITTTGEVRTELYESTRARVFISEEEAPATRNEITAPAQNILNEPTPETRYVLNGGINIAYQVLGDGPVDVVFVMGWVSHLEYFWKHHLFASFLRRLSSFSRLILFDKRGTGLSDRIPLHELPTLEQRMEDVHTVMDAVDSDRAVLIGVSEGGPMSALFAATYPERTAGLVMIGTYAKRIWEADYPWAPTEDQRRAFFELMQREWGGPVGIEERAPSMADDDEFRDWWATYLRMGASPGAAVALTEMNAEIDVRGVLPSVRVPTMVIHRKADLCLKVEEGRYVAQQIPGAEYLELEGSDHLPFVGDQEEILTAIERFVAGVNVPDDHDRVLATVMNVRFGYRKVNEDGSKGPGWESIDTRVREPVKKLLDNYRGAVFFVGDGEMLAAFDGPARAVRCASAIVRAANENDVPVSAGLHTGECDLDGNSYSGFAVELSKRVADKSLNGNIVVSRTVKDLVAGSGLSFRELGVEKFDDIEGDWRLFVVTGE